MMTIGVRPSIKLITLCDTNNMTDRNEKKRKREESPPENIPLLLLVHLADLLQPHKE